MAPLLANKGMSALAPLLAKEGLGVVKSYVPH